MYIYVDSLSRTMANFRIMRVDVPVGPGHSRWYPVGSHDLVSVHLPSDQWRRHGLDVFCGGTLELLVRM